MSVSELIARLARKAKIAKVERCEYARYRELMQSILDNSKEVDAEEAEALLDSMGKTFEDLRKDAEVFAKRLTWITEREAAVKAEPQLRSVEQKIEELKQVKQKFLNEHDRKIQMLGAERSQLSLVVDQLSTASHGLRQSVLDPRIIYERDELAKEALSLAQREDALVQQRGPGANTTLTALESAKTNLAFAQQEIERSSSQIHVDQWRRRVDDCAGIVRTLEARLKSIDDELQLVRSKLQQIRLQQSDLDRRCLVP